MSEDKTKTEEGKAAESSKMPLFIGVAVVAVIAAVLVFMSSGNGVAQKGDENANAEMAAEAQAQAQAEGDEPMIKLGNPVVAVVYEEEIRRSDVFNFISSLPENVRQMPIQQLFPLALDQVINNRVIGKKAENAELSGDTEVQELVDQARTQIVRNVYLERQVDAAITQKKLLAEYENLLDQISGIQETKARHILVETEEEAREVIARLEEGADFAELATEMSTGPTAENGGDLGYFAQNEMVPAFADTAFGLDVGAYTKDPVNTQFGWHVIKVDDRRDRPEPDFEDVKRQLEAQLRQRVLAELVEDWKDEAGIETFDINGEEVN